MRGWRLLLVRAGAVLLLLAALTWPLHAGNHTVVTLGPGDDLRLQSTESASLVVRGKSEQTRFEDDLYPPLTASTLPDPLPATSQPTVHWRWRERERLAPALIHEYHGSRYKSA